MVTMTIMSEKAKAVSPEVSRLHYTLGRSSEVTSACKTFVVYFLCAQSLTLCSSVGFSLLIAFLVFSLNVSLAISRCSFDSFTFAILRTAIVARAERFLNTLSAGSYMR